MYPGNISTDLILSVESELNEFMVIRTKLDQRVEGFHEFLQKWVFLI